MLYALKFFSVLALFIAFHSFSLPLVFGASAEGEDANKQVKPSYLTLSQDLNALKKHVYQRPCNQMFFAGSHNAWFSRERGFRKILWIIPMYDQEVGLKEQMECGARLFKTSLFWTKPKTPCCPKLKVYDGSYEDGQQIVMAHGNPPYGAIVPTWFMKKGEPELFSDGLNKLKELAVKELDNFENKLHRWMQKHPPTVEFLEDGKAFDKGLNVIVPAPIPPVFFLQLYSLLGKTGKELKRDLKKSGITDYVWYLELKKDEKTGRSYPVWPSVSEMIEKRKIFILLDSNPYDCALTKTELEKKEDITLTDEDYAARLKDPKNFPQDPEAPLSTYFIRSPLSLNYEGKVAEGGDQDGYDGLGLGGYFLTYHAKGVPQLRPLDYEQVNAYEGIKAHLTLCYQKNGSFPSSMQFQMINVGEAYPYKYAFRLDGLGVDLRGAKSIIEQISMWVNAHPASYFPTAGVLPPATRPRNLGALPALPIEANTSTQESRSGKDESKDG